MPKIDNIFENLSNRGIIMVNEMVKQYGTPLYLYDGDQIQENVKVLKSSIMSGANLYFSMKANPLVGLCQLINQLGCGIEVASEGELYLALKAGCNASNVIFSSPGKTREELEYAVEKHIHVINAESIEELELINQIASEQNQCVNVAIRINPRESKMNAKIKMSGVASQFGIEEDIIDDSIMNTIMGMNNIKLLGIQVYMGTQILQAEDIISNTEYIIKLAITLSAKYNFQLSYINMGGGFGVPYFRNEKDLDLQKLSDGMQLLNLKYKEELKNVELIFESGRFIMANAGRFITKVLYKKESKGKKFVVCDGGSNFHSASAFLGRSIRNNYPIYTVPAGDEKEEMTVTGPLCTPTDVIGQSVQINKSIKGGDLIVIDKSGAYGLTYSPFAFLGHKKPIEIMKYKHNIFVLNKRGELGDNLNGQIFLDFD